MSILNERQGNVDDEDDEEDEGNEESGVTVNDSTLEYSV
jgi:hypothetical protein